MFTQDEILEVIKMLTEEDLDIRSVTLSVNTMFAISDNKERSLDKLQQLSNIFKRFNDAVSLVEEKYGIRIVTRRVAMSPIQYFLEPIPNEEYALELAKVLDSIASDNNIDYISGYTAFAEKGLSKGAMVLLNTISKALNSTSRLSGIVNAASTLSGLNMDVIRVYVDRLVEMNPYAASRVAIMVNVPPDSPFIPSAHHGNGMPDIMVNVAVSGPGVIESAIKRSNPKDLRELYEVIKKASFKITRLGELIGKEVAKVMNVDFGSVDLSIAPSPKVMDSVARVLEAMGLEKVGAHGTITALAILTDAMKKGGSMATSSVGGLSGAFIPVSEDAEMTDSALKGYISFETLLAMSAICNTGIDMVGINKDEDRTIIAGLISDVLAMGMVLNKILGVRLIPVNAPPGSYIDLGGLLGKVAVIPLKRLKNTLTSMKGFIPNPVKRLEFG